MICLSVGNIQSNGLFRNFFENDFAKKGGDPFFDEHAVLDWACNWGVQHTLITFDGWGI